jgi:thiol-disulfide isomerase/thioredoxin
MRTATLLLLAALSLPAGAAGDPVLRPVDHEQWLEALAGHRGDLVVVDFWATWCLPCIERFPRMVELSERYADEGVTFIAFSLDDRDDSGAMAMAASFVAEQGGRIEHYVTAEVIPVAFEHLDLLGIPAVKIYARDGTLARSLDADDPNDQFTDEDVEAAIVELLAD